MATFPLHYCYFSFRYKGAKHDLRMWITDSLSLEWKLYINDCEVGCRLDGSVNPLMEHELAQALSFRNVNQVYESLLSSYETSQKTAP